MIPSAPAQGRNRLLWAAAGLVGLLWPLVVHYLLPHYGAWPLLIALAAIAWWRLPPAQRRWGWGLLPLILLLLGIIGVEFLLSTLGGQHVDSEETPTTAARIRNLASGRWVGRMTGAGVEEVAAEVRE